MTTKMNRNHFVRVSVLGQVGRFVSVDTTCYPRGTQVICRTRRGIEVGEVMSHALGATEASDPDGTLLRALTAEDYLVVERLSRNRDQAFRACQERLRHHGITTTLVDVEHLFDGKSLFFYFLGDVPSSAVDLMDELAQVYDAEVKFSDFAKAVEAGCGPACGTTEAAGCGEACSTCVVVKACKS